MPEVIYIRLKPYDKLAGNVRCDFTAPWGVKYIAGDWHEIPLDSPNQEQAIDYLDKVTQHVNDPHSKKAFDVCTYAEAQELIASEKGAKLKTLYDDMQEPEKAPMSLESKRSSDLNRAEATHELETRPAPESAPPPTAVTSDPLPPAAEPTPVPKPRRKATAKKPASKKPASRKRR